MLFKHILVPLDGSAVAECVLSHLNALTSGSDTYITLARVIGVDNESCPDQPVDPLGWRFNRAEAEAYLDNTAQMLRETGHIPNVETALLEGNPPDRMIEFAHQNNVDLILLSSHGRSGISRWNVSSVVRKIIQRANVSTMMVRAYECGGEHADLQYKRVLIPLDGSLRAEVALPIAAALAHENNGKLVLAHVLHRPEIIQRVPPSAETQQLIDQMIQASTEAAHRYIEQIHSRLQLELEFELRVSNNVSSTLAQIVSERQIDLVVLSAHGHSCDPKRTFGTITAGLLEYGAGSLLIVQDLTPEELQPTRAEEAAREHRGHV